MSAPELTTTAAVALGGAAVLAVANWWSVSTGRRVVEWVTKPGVMVLLIVAALALEPVHGATRAWLVVGLVCSLAGDVFLMLPEERFVAGLASFLLGHVAYVVAFSLERSSVAGLVVGLALVAVGVALVGRRVVAAVRRDEPAFAAPVVAYLVVISAMVVAACATANPWAIAGAVCFFASDGLLAWNKFVGSFRGARFAVMSTYHLAQFGLVLSLVW